MGWQYRSTSYCHSCYDQHPRLTGSSSVDLGHATRRLYVNSAYFPFAHSNHTMTSPQRYNHPFGTALQLEATHGRLPRENLPLFTAGLGNPTNHPVKDFHCDRKLLTSLCTASLQMAFDGSFLICKATDSKYSRTNQVAPVADVWSPWFNLMIPRERHL